MSKGNGDFIEESDSAIDVAITNIAGLSANYGLAFVILPESNDTDYRIGIRREGSAVVVFAENLHEGDLDAVARALEVGLREGVKIGQKRTEERLHAAMRDAIRVLAGELPTIGGDSMRGLANNLVDKFFTEKLGLTI